MCVSRSHPRAISEGLSLESLSLALYHVFCKKKKEKQEENKYTENNGFPRYYVGFVCGGEMTRRRRRCRTARLRNNYFLSPKSTRHEKNLRNCCVVVATRDGGTGRRKKYAYPAFGVRIRPKVYTYRILYIKHIKATYTGRLVLHITYFRL